MNPQRPHLVRRLLSGLLAFLIGFGPLTPLASAAVTPLADQPIAVKNNSHPNIVYTLDDSTSMQLNFLPDYVVVNTLTNAATTWCRSTATNALAACGSVGSETVPQYIFAEWLDNTIPPANTVTMPAANRPKGAGVTFPWPAAYGNSSNGPPPVMTSSFNAMFYNPLVTYTAPIKYDGTSYNNQNAGNTTNYTRVQVDPYLFPTKYVDLTLKVNVGVWCNTTYAGSFSTVAATNTANLVGTTIGGDYCRINGWSYALGANNAPAVNGDYNYPFAKSGTADTSGPENFFAINTRTIYCDPAKMNGLMSSTSGETLPTAPTCDACALSCPVAVVEDPTTPVGCDPGCKNPAECKICGTKCPVDLTYSCGRTCTTPALNCTASGGSNTPAQPKTCDPGPNQKCTTHPGSCGTTTSVWTPNNNACARIIGDDTATPKRWLVSPWVTANAPGVIGKTYEQDANTDGIVCRRNNFTYTDVTAGGWRYPDAAPVALGKYTTAVGSCGTVTAAINRHYYKAAVQWCNTQQPFVTTMPNANAKWRGYGTGTCQAEKSDTYKWPRFFKAGVYTADSYKTTQANDNANPAFELVELDYVNKKVIVRGGTPADNITHTFENGDTVTRAATGDTPEANELVNYANWFAYYRTRILAAKTVSSIVFSELTDKFRVGFHTLSNYPASTFLTLADFEGGAGKQRDKWYQKLTGVSIPMGNDTPLLDAVARIGEWFEATDGTHAALSGSSNPINLSCQKSYHVMFTDGYTNQIARTTGLPGNIDGSPIPKLPEEILELPKDGTWPKKIKEGATAVSDSLSDYTLKHWLTDLRPDTFDKSVAENNVPSSEVDPAKWQHLNFAALSLGTEGVLSSNQKLTESQIEAGTTLWPTPSPVNRPGTAGVDDLWHAAIAGRSQFVNARDPQELQTGMTAILDEIANSQASRAGVAFGNVNFGASGNYIYRVTIEPGWGGTLTKVEVDPKGKGEIAIGTKYHEILSAQVTPSTGNLQPWYDKRNVVTFDPDADAGVAFRLGSMPTWQSDTLGKNDAEREKVIAYLRGDTSNEGSALKNYRARSQILGDIANSSPVVVGAPMAPYSDSTDPGYEKFKSDWSTRKKMVYVGANDGMLHAFDEATGKEVFAYVPSFLYDSSPDKGLGMLAKKSPYFKHQMFVDSTPVAVDVDIGGKWYTYLIGGLGKGGKGYYALDITNPAGIENEADAASRLKWEFTDSDMGYTYGKPLVAKTYADGWVAIFPAGYNNASGKGKLFFVRLSDGALLRTLETTAGSASDPSGLAQVSGFTLSFKNQYVEQIYGGDLLGNVWRFDVSAADPASWTVVKLAELTSGDPAGSAQSVTTAPQIEVDIANGVDRYVMIGTGRLLHEDDLETYAGQVQTMYVIRDGTVLKTNTSGLPHKPRIDGDFTSVANTNTLGFSGLSVKGWYMDLPKGERIIAPIASELGLLGWAGSKPPENDCQPGLAASVYVRTFPHADSLLLDEGGTTAVASIEVKEGAVGMEFVNIYSETPNDPTLKLVITLGTDGKSMTIDLKKVNLTGDPRMSWRLMGR